MNNPLVSVIVTHHLDENREYLDLCLKALNLSIGVDFEVLVMSDAKTKPDIPNTMKLIHYQKETKCLQKVDDALFLCDPNSKYTLLLSDDVIVSKYTLRSLCFSADCMEGIFIPMSNSDMRSQYATNIFLQRTDKELRLETDMDIAQIRGWEDSIIHFQPERFLIVPVPWVTFFCTLIPKSIWKKVGGLDHALETRFNDHDFCIRAAKLGIRSYISFETFAFHFGSKTLNKMTISLDEKNEAIMHFNKKHPGTIQIVQAHPQPIDE